MKVMISVLGVLLLAAAARADVATQNVAITVTHSGGGGPPGGGIPTFTFMNNSGATMPAGTPVTMAQAFRYDDIPSGTHPVIQDATTHVPLAHQQWNEISTWRENGGDGSWRHAVWSIDLPAALANGATYQIEFPDMPGAYSQSPVLALSTLCSGANSHNLAIHLTDVRNQDDTVRATGDATFNLCANITNVGRDAPRILDQGSVRTTAKVVGLFTYTDGSKDPLLYAECNVGLYVDPATGNSLKDTSAVCWIHNSWVDVAAGTTGYTGNIGPVGLANDPQAVSYRPEMVDGASSVLNWSGMDATVASSSNPVITSGCGNVYDTGNAISNCLNIPTSTGLNTWYYGMPVRITSTGTPVGGLGNGGIKWVYPNGMVNHNCGSTNLNTIMDQPSIQSATAILTNSQGSGNTTFSFRVWHPKFMSWLLMDTTADDNWFPGGTTTRVTREIIPAFIATEKRYWEQSGIITPLDFTNANSGNTNWAGLQCNYGDSGNYYPFTRGSVIGGAGVGARPDLGFPNSYAAQAFIAGSPSDYKTMRIYSTVATNFPFGSVLDEASGRIMVANNGPPIGPGGNGIWNNNTSSPAPYTGLAIPRIGFNMLDHLQMVYPRQGVVGQTVTNVQDPAGGIWPYPGWGSLDHQSNFQGFSYAIFGSRQWLDALHLQGNRSYSQLYNGPELGRKDDNVNNQRSPITSPYHFWGLSTVCCQSRGSARALWDKIQPAALGGDNNIERTYYNDIMNENWNYYQQWLAWVDGPGSNNFRTSITLPNYAGETSQQEVFIGNYNFAAAYEDQTYLHGPMAVNWMNAFQRYIEGVCGETAANHPVSFYCIDYTVTPAINNTQADIFYNPSLGQYYNGVDAADFYGNAPFNSAQLKTGGQIFENAVSYHLTNGDLVRLAAGEEQLSNFFDQLNDGKPRPMMNVNTGASSFYIQCNAADHTAFPTQCPTAGQPFNNFTRNGVLIQNENGESFAYRPQYDPGAGGGFTDVNYAKYAKMISNGLQILNYDVSHAQPIMDIRMGATAGSGQSAYGFESWQWWDPTIVVPGSGPVAGALFTTASPSTNTISCAAAPGTVVSAIAVTGGNGNAVTLTPSGDTTDFALSTTTPPANVIVATGGISPCTGKITTYTVTATQALQTSPSSATIAVVAH